MPAIKSYQSGDLGVGIIGSGRIGTLRANMASRHPSVRFLAVSDLDPERAGLLGQCVNADFTSSDNLRVISHPEVNTVIVSTPEHEHTLPILQALDLGKPVFVEKPLALTLDEADQIVAAVEKSGVELRIGYSRRHDRRWMLAKEQIVQRRLGDILGIQSRVYNTRAHMMEILKRSPEATPVLDALTYYVDMAVSLDGGNSGGFALSRHSQLKPWQKKEWCIPKVSAEFVANMEDLLDLYAEPYDPRRPVVCFDETSTQLLADTRTSLPSRPGIPLRQDYEYRREGVRNLFLTCEPLAGWRHVAVTRRRTMEDFAHQMRWLVDEAYPDTPVVRVVIDNLNTHRPASLYETFPAPEARRIAKRLEFHYTPKHGSWLNPVLSLSKGWRKSSSAYYPVPV